VRLASDLRRYYQRSRRYYLRSELGCRVSAAVACMRGQAVLFNCEIITGETLNFSTPTVGLLPPGRLLVCSCHVTHVPGQPITFMPKMAK